MSNIWKEKLGKDLLDCNIRQYCIANIGIDGEDVFAECLYKVFKLPNVKLKDIYDRGKHLDYFFLICRNSIYNYYKKKRIEWVQIPENYDIEDEEYYENGNDILDLIEEWGEDHNSMWWYHSRLIKLYVDEGSYRLVSKKTGIPFNSIRVSVREFKNWINEIYSELGLDI